MAEGIEDGVGPEETIVEDDRDAVTEWAPFEEIQDECVFGPMNHVEGPDGMPLTQVPKSQTDSTVPSLSPETLVCMGDFSEFVVRDRDGFVMARWSPDKVEQLPTGAWRARLSDATHVEAGYTIGARPYVRPVRPPCEHYIRQAGQFEENPEFIAIYRLCSARRSTEGAFMSVRDSAMWACDMREPRHLESEKKYLDDFDEKKIRQGQQRRYLPMIGSK